MKKICTVFLLSALLLTVTIPILSVSATGADVLLSVEASAATINPGDKITFTVYISADTSIAGWQFDLDIPAGFNYDAGSGAIDPNFISATGATKASFTELTKRVLVAGSDNLTLNGKIPIAVFKCTSTENTSGSYNIGVNNAVILDGNADIMHETDYQITAASVTVIPPNYTTAPETTGPETTLPETTMPDSTNTTGTGTSSSTGSTDSSQTTDSDSSGGDQPYTGYNSSLVLWVALMLLMGVGIIGLVVFGNKKETKASVNQSKRIKP